MVSAKFIGCSADMYQSEVALLEGSYLDGTKDNEVLLTQTMASQVDAAVGDTIRLMYQKDGENEVAEVYVQGIVEMPLLSMFGVDVAFMNIDAVQKLYGYNNEVCSEVIVYTSDNTNTLQKKVQNKLKEADIKDSVAKVVRQGIHTP